MRYALIPLFLFTACATSGVKSDGYHERVDVRFLQDGPPAIDQVLVCGRLKEFEGEFVCIDFKTFMGPMMEFAPVPSSSSQSL